MNTTKQNCLDAHEFYIGGTEENLYNFCVNEIIQNYTDDRNWIVTSALIFIRCSN